jgi:hypothetical protein
MAVAAFTVTRLTGAGAHAAAPSAGWTSLLDRGKDVRYVTAPKIRAVDERR